MISVRKPGETALFIDHEYYFIGHWFFDPTKPLSSFDPIDRFETRWHKKKPHKDYGVGNISWVDGHVSVEPKDFASIVQNGGKKARWKYYYYNH